MSDRESDVNANSAVESNVADFEKEKKQREGKARGRPKKETGGADETEPQKKDLPAEIYESIHQALIDGPLLKPDFPKPDFRIAMVKTSTSIESFEEIPVLIQGEGDRLKATKLTIKAAAKMIGGFVRKSLGTLHRRYKMTADSVEKCAEYWAMHFEALPTPRAMHFKSEPGLSWERADFDPIKGPCPTWDGIMRGIANPDAKEALQAYFWSVFEPKSYNQQYLWIKGPGGDGKSSACGLLVKILGVNKGALEQSVAPGSNGDNFWAIQYEDKWLALFADLKTEVDMDSGELKMLTGGHTLPVRPMRAGAYNVPHHIKTIWLSQKWPVISTDRASLRRPIPIEMVRIGDDVDAQFEEKLWAERAAIMYRCRESYQKMCPNHEKIVVTKEMIGPLTDSASGESSGQYSDFESWYEQTFTRVPGAKGWAQTVDELIKRRFPERKTQAEFRSWLIDIAKHKKCREGLGEVRRRYYEDLELPADHNKRTSTQGSDVQAPAYQRPGQNPW